MALDDNAGAINYETPPHSGDEEALGAVEGSEDWPAEDMPLLQENNGERKEDITNDEEHRGSGTVFSSTFSLTNTIMGSGILTLPYAFESAGLFFGIFFLLLMGTFANCTFRMLVACSDATGEITYKRLAVRAFGKYSSQIVEAFVVCYTTGTCIAFPIIVGDTLQDVLKRYLPNDSFFCQRWVVVCMAMAFIMFPLAAQKSLYILSYASLLAVSSLVFVMVMIIERYFQRYRTETTGSIHYVNASPTLFMAMPLMTVAFAAHYNALNIYKEMRVKVYGKMCKSINFTTLIASSVYIMYAGFGYLSFLSKTQSDILNNYDEYDTYADIARIVQGLVICITYPVIHFALRRSLLNILFPSSFEKYWPKYLITTICLCTFHAAVASVVKSLGVVLSFSGSIFGCNIVFILPSLFFLRLVPLPLYHPRKLIAFVTLIAGVIFLILGLTEATLHAFGVNIH